jgi:hypothetical protein
MPCGWPPPPDLLAGLGLKINCWFSSGSFHPLSGSSEDCVLMGDGVDLMHPSDSLNFTSDNIREGTPLSGAFQDQVGEESVELGTLRGAGLRTAYRPARVRLPTGPFFRL